MSGTFLSDTEPTYLLDHGFVRLVDLMGTDLSIIRAARVSYNAAWRAGGDEFADIKLLRRLWSGKPSTYTGPLPESPKHSTPFESCTVTFEVMAPIFVFRQWHRHRTQSYNELSARYRELPESYYVPDLDDIGYQSPSSKQGRETTIVTNEDIEQRRQERDMFNACCTHSYRTYRYLLDHGWPRELARAVLPVSMYSHMFTTMNLLNFFRFATLRVDGHAQHEIRVYAKAMVDLLEPHFPCAVALFKEANP